MENVMNQVENNKEKLTDEKVSEVKAGEEQAENKGHKKHIAVWIILGAVILLALIYGGISFYYQNRFFPNTQINNMDCSNLEASVVTAMVERQVDLYTLEVMGRDWQTAGEADAPEVLLGTVTAKDINLAFKEVSGAVQNVLEKQNPLLWPQGYFGKGQSFTLTLERNFDEELLEELLMGWGAFQKENMTAPKDAYISEYHDGMYEIVSETKGNLLDVSLASEKMKEMIYAGEETLDLEAENCYQTARVTAENEKLQENCRTINKWVQTCVTYDWNGTEVIVDGKRIQKWIAYDKAPELDEEAVADFVAETAKTLDTYGKKRKFKTVAGVERTLPSGAYGWKTDRGAETEELLQLIYQGSVVEKEPVYAMKAASKGEDDIGSSYVEIDLGNQHLYVIKEKEIVLESDLVSGHAERSLTPPGVFGITYKTKNAVLRGETWETPVSYWMPFNGNIGMHDATWRRSFGGTIYKTSGSHGCINLPLDKAKQIYGYVSTGFPVVCYY